MNCIETEDLHGIEFCNRQKIVVEHGQGTVVWDETGARYLDFTSGWGVTCLGHAHPVVTAAIRRQAGKIIQNPNSGFTYSPARAELLKRLQPLLPMGLNRMFFVNSGTEANDAAIKLARKISGRTRIISTLESFHGRTFNALSVSGGPANIARYIPVPAETQFVPYGNLEAFEKEITRDVAAVIIEPVQGEGGVRIPPQGYLENVSRLCNKNSVLLIVDEIQTGFGRTGKMFALEHSSKLSPDFLTMGKGIAGGFPIAGFAVSDRVALQIEKGDHGGTYCGNPLGCAVAAVVIDYLAGNRVADRAATRGKLLLEGLHWLQKRFPDIICDTRGIGLLTALQLTNDELVSELTSACLQYGLLVTPTRNAIVRLIPDLLVSEAHIKEALGMLDNALGSLYPRVAAAS